MWGCECEFHELSSNNPFVGRGWSAVADAVPPSTWIDHDLADCEFKDERRGKRFRLPLEQLSASSGDSIPLVCQDWANTKAEHLFLDNDRVNEAEILAGHFEAMRDRVTKTTGPILVLHDTPEFSYKRDDIDAVGRTRLAVCRYPLVLSVPILNLAGLGKSFP